MALFGPLVVIILVVLVAASSLRVLREYQRGVVFQLGRFWKVKGPGLVILIPGIQQMVRVELRTVVLDVPTQDVISRDNVSVKVNAVVYFRVVDPQKAIIEVENFLMATWQLAQTTLRSVLGKHDLDEMLVAAREAQHRHPADARRADALVGHQGRQRRDEARRHRPDDDPRHCAPGRSRTRAAGEGDSRRRRNAGGAEAFRGGPRCCPARRWRSSCVTWRH